MTDNYKMKSAHIPPEMVKGMFQGMSGPEDPVKSDFDCPTCKTPLFYPEPRVLRTRDGRRYKDLVCPKCKYTDSQEFVKNTKIIGVDDD